MSKSPAKKQKTVNFSRDEPRITDPRFANIQSDPRFRLPGRKNKVKLDKRFSRVLDDEDFTKRAKVDRYGRPLENDAEKTRLKRKYDFDEDEDQEQEQEGHSDGDDDDDQPDNDDEVQRELRRLDNGRDLLRQGRDSDSASVTSSDETSSSDEDDDNPDDAVDHEPTIGPTSQSEIPMGEVTSRIAVVNLDWDNIRAADIMAVINSFLPASGSLLQVSIYPSEFGKERLEREEMEGPPREIFAIKDDGTDDNNMEHSEDEDDSDADAEIKDSLLAPDTGAEFDSAALRRYQLDRLRYYYCVLTFSSPSVAEHVYSAVDGTEYLTTANFFDLRFVPDDTDFSSDTPKEECTTIPDDYRPNEFVTDALQHSKVRLTWDADDGSRKETIARAFKGGRQEIDENDLKAYLASDSSSDDERQEDANGAAMSKKEIERQKMRAALGLAPEPVKKTPSSKGEKKAKAPVGDMQITFTSGFSAPTEGDEEGDSKKKNKKKNRGVFENSPEPDETTVEKYVRKERERKQRRKNKKEASDEDGGDDNDDAEDHTDQAQGEAADAGDLGFDDPFFTSTTAAAPSAQEEKAASNRLRKEERMKKKKEREAEEEAERKQRAELELLMIDDDADVDGAGSGDENTARKIRHFNMKEIERAEKIARKKNKGKKNKKNPANAGDADAGGVDANANGDDQFKVDTSDPRFARLFDSHEYAIDPTNPRFKGTQGMREVLEEGRRRRAKKDKKDRQSNRRGGGGGKEEEGDGEEVKEIKTRTKKSATTTKQGSNDDGADVDLKHLVKKIKMRSTK